MTAARRGAVRADAQVRNAADLYAYTGSATVTMADALRKSKPQSPGVSCCCCFCGGGVAASPRAHCPEPRRLLDRI